MTLFLICVLVWLGAAVAFLAMFAHAARHDLPDLPDLDVSREEWQAHCDEALAVGNDQALKASRPPLFIRADELAWSATDEAAYRVTVERAT